MRAHQCRPLLLLALIVAAWAETDFQRASTPALLWGSQSVFGPTATRVNYESLLLSDVWTGLMKPGSKGADPSAVEILAEGASTPETTVVFIGNQMQPSNLGGMKPLQKALRGSSSILFPNARHEGSGAEFARALAEDDDISAELVGSCATEERGQNIAETLPTVLEGSSGKEGSPRVVVVCSASDSLAGEMADFAIVLSALEEKKYVMVYVSREPGSDGLTGAKRSLLAQQANSGPYTTCEGVCPAQVKFLEGIILALVLALALAAGLCCTHILDGPSQFEKAEGEAGS